MASIDTTPRAHIAHLSTAAWKRTSKALRRPHSGQASLETTRKPDRRHEDCAQVWGGLQCHWNGAAIAILRTPRGERVWGQLNSASGGFEQLRVVSLVRLAGLLLPCLVWEVAVAQDGVLLRLRGRPGQRWTRTTASSLQIARIADSTVTADTLWATSAQSLVYWTRTVLAISGDTLTVTDVRDSSGDDVTGARDLPRRPPGSSSRLALLSQIDIRGRVFAARWSGSGSDAGPSESASQGEGQTAEARAAFLLPERRVQVGESWEDSTRLRLSDGASGIRHRCWKLESIRVEASDTIAVISGTTSLDMAGRTPRHQSTATQYVLDLSLGWFRSERSTTVGSESSGNGRSISKLDMLSTWQFAPDR